LIFVLARYRARDADGQAHPAELKRAELLGNTFGRHLGLFLVRIRKDDGEFVAAVAEARVDIFTYANLDYLAQGPKHLVATWCPSVSLSSLKWSMSMNMSDSLRPGLRLRRVSSRVTWS